MTKSERGRTLAMCLGGGMITGAGYLVSTGGDLTLALALLSVGYIPFIADLMRELQIDPDKRIFVGIILTLAIPAGAVLAHYVVGLLLADNAWAGPILHWGAILLTGLVGTSFSFILVYVVVEEIMDRVRSNRRRSVI